MMFFIIFPASHFFFYVRLPQYQPGKKDKGKDPPKEVKITVSDYALFPIKTKIQPYYHETKGFITYMTRKTMCVVCWPEKWAKPSKICQDKG